MFYLSQHSPLFLRSVYFFFSFASLPFFYSIQWIDLIYCKQIRIKRKWHRSSSVKCAFRCTLNFEQTNTQNQNSANALIELNGWNEWKSVTNNDIVDVNIFTRLNLVNQEKKKWNDSSMMISSSPKGLNETQTHMYMNSHSMVCLHHFRFLFSVFRFFHLK